MYLHCMHVCSSNSYIYQYTLNGTLNGTLDALKNHHISVTVMM